MTLIGIALPSLDAEDRVTGTVKFTLNLDPPGVLHGQILRSPHPHAHIVRIDTSAAEALPGIVAVLSGADMAPDSELDPYYGSLLKDQQVIAIEKVRYVGEPVVAIAAEDVEVARAALELIDVEYEELPAIFDPIAALAPDAPWVHEGISKQPPDGGRVAIQADAGTNIVQSFQLSHGDVEAGFAAADYVFEHTFTSPAANAVPLEPHVVVAQVAPGRVTVWTATQAPHNVRRQLAGIFRLPLEQIRVIAQPIGGGFGAKSHTKLEPLVAALAWKARGRPVKIVLSRAEDFVIATKHAVIMTFKTGVMKDGRLVARQATLRWNAGAYADTSPLVTRNGGLTGLGPYRIPNARVDSMSIYTNTPTAASFRGLAVNQVAWAGESQIDIIAHALDLDPLELRLMNVLEDGDTHITGETLHEVHYKNLLREAADKIGWGKPGSGRGIACIMKGTATPSTSKARIRLDMDGHCTLLTSSVEIGQGAHTVLSQIAADALGLPIEQVSIVNPDTDMTPFDLSTSSSRTTYSMGNALLRAADDLKKQLRQAAADAFSADPEALAVEGGRVFLPGDASRSLSFAEIVQRMEQPFLIGDGTFTTQGGLDPKTNTGIASVHWHQAVGATRVEVDEETGRIRVNDFHAAVYAGRVVNPAYADLQNQGGVVMGLGGALFEEMLFDSGQVLNANLADYLIPSLADIPTRLTSTSLESRAGHGDFHGIAESAIPTVAPAIGNALFDAAGVRLFDLPLMPEKVLRALRERQTA